MPSPTSSTSPVSRRSICWPNSLISRPMTEAISSALNLIAAPREELVLDGFQTGADRAVVHLVAHLHHQAAQQLGVHARLQHRFLLELRAQLLPEPILLGVGEG